MISSKYVLKDKQEPIDYNAVTLSSDEVSIKVVNSKDWKIDLSKIPRVSTIVIIIIMDTNFLKKYILRYFIFCRKLGKLIFIGFILYFKLLILLPD